MSSPVISLTPSLPQALTDKRFTDGRLIRKSRNTQVFDALWIDSTQPGIALSEGHFNHQPVRITILSDNASPSLKQQFISAARLQQELSHKGITEVLAVYDEERLTAYVEEKFDGMTLEEILALSPGPMSTDRIKSIMSSVCSALSHCHNQHVVHGALRPKAINIVWIAGLESTKISNFGSSGTMSDVDALSGDEDILLNQLSYLAPEQDDRRTPASAQTDIYSLGVLLYRMATGSLPFRSNRAAEIKKATQSLSPRKPSQVIHSINGDLDELVLRAMKKAPEERWSSVDELLKHLRALDVLKISPLIDGDPRSEMRGQTDGAMFGDRAVNHDIIGLKHGLQTSPGTSIPSILPQLANGQSQIVAKHPDPQQIGQQSDDIQPQRTVSRKTLSTGQLPSIHGVEFNVVRAKKITMSVPDSDVWNDLIRQDSSETTIFIPMSNPPKIGESIRLSIRVSNGPRFSIRGVIGWRRQTKESHIDSGAGMTVLSNDEDTLGYVTGWFNGEKQERRQIRRLPIKLQATYQAKDGNKHLTITRDLNKWGLFLQGKVDLELGTSLSIDLFVPGKLSAYALTGSVSRTVEDGLDYGFGVALTFESSDRRARYHQLINDLESEFFAGTLDEALLV